ncbi:MAG TPA: ABC transporter substrate-binding protein [Chloroflexota bacterium]|nr:ABC transporter substrate-binding protein [Chloroflexota bacterium]
MKIMGLSVLIALSLLLSGCGSGAAPGAQPASSPQSAGQGAASAGGLSGEIPVGAVWSLTGAAAVYGTVQKNAADLATDEINRSGFLGSAKLKLITEDDRSTREGGIAAFEKLLNRDRVAAILGPTLSNTARATDPMAQDKGIVVLGVSNTADGIVEIGDFVFRDSLPESDVQPNTIRVTKDKLGYRRVAVLYGDDDAFTKAGYDVFSKALADAGVQVVATETFKKGDTDFSAQLTKIRSANPDAIVLSALAEEAAGIMTQARQLGIPTSVPFIGGNGLNSPQLAQLAGSAAQGAISGAAWFISNDTPGNAAFVQAYRDRYGSDPDQFAAQAYTGVYLLATALKNAGSSNPRAIRDALAQLKDVPTVLGSFSFDPSRNPVHPPVVQIVQDGKFTLFK